MSTKISNAFLRRYLNVIDDVWSTNFWQDISIAIPDSGCHHNWLKNLSESSLFFNDDDLVGINKAQRRLLGWLMDQELQMTVISMVGMGGLGKTSLVANTFNKQAVKQHFDCCVWIAVSQQYVVKELFKSMISELYDKSKETFDTAINVDSMSYGDLVETLLKFLQPRRYLIVIDDVWSTNFWQDSSIALPANTNGSRILLTTRREDVASFEFVIAKHILPLKPLPVYESWALFCKKGFVAKCEGLPLAIVALGGLIASKNSMAKWNGMYENLNWELTENETFEWLKYISLLSYHDLYYRLKQCFLFCSIFPEDCVIKRKRLIRIWMPNHLEE
ncbi:Detected protein of unknown function [Hibiscus syriacus]|uniref:NB-ARC domain-containing protein n=1 Tax=Hibiscus syriacus TaxID=106335 RepID=A0A6A2YZ33_HIBSY|nr:Detected protein of unknown function [Hibiscus syriacus]